MSSATKDIFQSARLPGFIGRGGKYLGELAQELRRVLWKTQNTFAVPSGRLPDAAWSDVAVLLVEWGEDIHNDIGLWRTVETHQWKCFGTPLPLIVNAPAEAEPRGFDPRRIQFFLWSLCSCASLRSRTPLFHNGNVGYPDEFQIAAGLVEHQRLSVLGDQAVFGLFNADDISIVEPKRIRLKRPTVVDFQQGLSRHGKRFNECRDFVKCSSGVAGYGFSPRREWGQFLTEL